MPVLINGKLFPYLEVEPRKYRFRVLNGSNARFYNLAFQNGLPILSDRHRSGAAPAPVSLKATQLAPGERADLLVDFTDSRGDKLVLKNDRPESCSSAFRPTKSATAVPCPKRMRPVPKIPESAATKTRLLTLDEYRSFTGEPVLLLLNASYWHDPITEKPALNSTEIWSFINPTDDTHPIHLHTVRFQILDRQHYEPWTYQTKQQFRFLGPRVPPEPFEAGWKDTAAAHSRMVTRIIVPFNAYAGKYVWHCHILEHEDNEMMRPYEIVAGITALDQDAMYRP